MTSIRFYSIDEINYCDIKIKVEELYESNKIIYKINYSNQFSKNHENLEDYIDASHPFYHNNLVDYMYGHKIDKNSMTEKMIEYLLMDVNKLKCKVCEPGITIYKGKIMSALVNL